MSEISISSKVVVLGVGTGGCKIAAELAQTPSAERLSIILLDTDRKALECYPEFNTLLIGSDWTDKQGCGGDMQRGRKAAGASSRSISELLEGAEMLITVCPLGGGTGSGAIPVIASIARKLKILSLFFVTRPFSFEGNLRFKNAEETLKDVVKSADAVICIENDTLFDNLSGNFSMDFNAADKTLAECIAGIAEMIFTDGLIKIDFVHVKKLLQKREAECHIGIGSARGEDKITAAIENLLSSATLGGLKTLSKSNAAIITLLSGPDLSMSDINLCITKVKELFDADAELNIGVSTCASRENFLQLTILSIIDSESEGPPEQSPVKITSKRQKRSKNENATVYDIQGELPLMELTSGIFEHMSPTLYHGQDLDIPTFQRMGINIDTGDEA